MANSRIMLVCKHCGENFCIGKGYYGSYSTCNDELHKQLNIFYNEHEHGCCSDDTDCSDNARNHFAILEEGETLAVLDADVVPKSEVERLENTYSRAVRKADKKAIVAIQNAKQEVAREIFEEMEKIATAEGAYDYVSIQDIAELKKKYTEEKE